MLPRISVITATFNSAKTLPDTLIGLAAQNYPDLEFILVDGGSRDNTVELARQSGILTQWVSERDDGVYDAQRKGIGMASGDLIGIINSDDYYLEGALHRIAQASLAHPNAGVFYGDQLYENLDGNVVRVAQPHPIAPRDFWRMPINTATAFVRRDVYERLGAFDTRYRISADCDLFLRFASAGIEFALVEGPLALTRAGGLSDRKYFDAHVERVKILIRQRAHWRTVVRAVNRLARYPIMSLRTGRAFRRSRAPATATQSRITP